MRYDIENLLDNIKTVLVNNLNAKITALNAEKNDGLTLPEIKTEAYFFQGLNEKVANFDPFIVYGFDDISTIELQQRSALDISMSVVVVVVDQGKPNINRLMIRYSRALKEVIEENYQKVGNGIKLSIQQAVPISFELLDSDSKFKAVGITINATLP